MRRRALQMLLVAAALAGCRGEAAPSPGVAIGDARRGRALVTTYGCNTCHTIPGVPGARSTVGPPLDRFARRVYAGGRPNTPANLVEFLVDPRAVDPHTPMPDVGVTEADARDLAAFLYTLR
jgi:cytochrome c